MQKKNKKILKYHSDEIKLLLFICVSDFSNLDKENIVVFAEAIEGSIHLLEFSNLNLFSEYILLDDLTMKVFEELKTKLKNFFESQWSTKLAKNSNERNEIKILADKILQLTKIQYQNPNYFMENNFEIDW